MSDDIDYDEFGFDPAVSATDAESDTPTATSVTSAPARRSRRAGLGRRIGVSAALFAALACMGSAYAAFATTSSATDTGNSASDIAAGRQLFQTTCITCHGANLEGIKDQGPALLGVGGAAVYFQVTTGRMPLAQQGADAPRKTAKFTDAEVEQIAAYVQHQGGGPVIPQGNLVGGNESIAGGGDLFRLNCASCHGATGKGAPLTAGKEAPSLNVATAKQLYGAMLTGPGTMPIFSDNTITPAGKKSIIAYVKMLNTSDDPGGNGIDRIGPVSEAIVIWVAGVGGLMLAILWIGARSR